MAGELTVFSALNGLVRKEAPRSLQAVMDRGWTTLYNSQSPFNFQLDIHCSPEAVLRNWTVFSCMTLIAGDLGKMRAMLQEQDANGIWAETDSPAFSPVLRKPNDYQTWQKFIESWWLSKGSRGNTYILKERDERRVVIAMHVLDPDRVVVHVAKDGRVYYRLADDKLAGIPDGDEVYAPASEIIHDRMWCLFHPLIGLSPIFANALAASQGLKIQENSAVFFGNMSRPSGTLTAPGFLTNEQADIYKQRWHDNYGPGKQGQTAILGSGLKYEAMTQTAEDSQLVEQLKMSAEMICSTFHVPCYKVGVGPMPPYQSAAILDQIYYDCCLQTLIKGIESGLDDGLGLGNGSGRKLRVKLDLDDLLAMDEGGLTDVLVKQAGAGIASPNEQRKRLNLAPVKGGESPKIQQQNYSLEAIDARDRGPDPFGTAKPPAPALPDSPDTPDKALEQMIARHVETMVAFRAEFVAIEQKRVEAEARETARRLEAEAKEAERIARVAEESARVEKSAREAAEAVAEQRRIEAEERRMADERARADDEKLGAFLKTFRAMCEDESA